MNKGFEFFLGVNRLFQRKTRKIKAIEDFSTYIQLINPEITEYEIAAVLGKPDENRMEFLEKWIKAQQEISSKLVLIVPKSAALNKNWPVAYFSEINNFLNNKGIIPAYIGSKVDAEYIEKIKEKNKCRRCI